MLSERMKQELKDAVQALAVGITSVEEINPKYTKERQNAVQWHEADKEELRDLFIKINDESTSAELKSLIADFVSVARTVGKMNVTGVSTTKKATAWEDYKALEKKIYNYIDII